MTAKERLLFELQRRWYKIKYGNKWWIEADKRNRERIDKIVKDVVEDGNPYRVWGGIFPSCYVTEWEIRYVEHCNELDGEDLKRWFKEKQQDIEWDMQ